VRDVAAGAVARDEEARGVAVLGQPRLLLLPGRRAGAAGGRHGPDERGPGVVVGGGCSGARRKSTDTAAARAADTSAFRKRKYCVEKAELTAKAPPWK